MIKATTNQKKKKGKHIPQRTCVGCRETLSKRELMRVVRTSAGVVFDPTGKANGRGAYLHNKLSCWERALKGSLALALKIELTESDKNYLREVMKNLPDESEEN